MRTVWWSLRRRFITPCRRHDTAHIINWNTPMVMSTGYSVRSSYENSRRHTRLPLVKWNQYLSRSGPWQNGYRWKSGVHGVTQCDTATKKYLGALVLK